MSTRARRLFTLDGDEIFYCEHIQRDVEYCVSSGEDFRLPEVRSAISYSVFREQTPRDRGRSREVQSKRLDSTHTSVEQRGLLQKTTSHTETNKRMLVDSTTYVYISHDTYEYEIRIRI